MGYFRSVGGSSGGGTQIVKNLYPFTSKGNMMYKIIVEMMKLATTDIENLTQIEINGRIGCTCSASSVVLRMYLCIIAHDGTNFYYYNTTNKQWLKTNTLITDSMFKIGYSESGEALFAEKSVASGSYGYEELSKIVDMSECFEKANELGLSFDFSQTTCTFGVFTSPNGVSHFISPFPVVLFYCVYNSNNYVTQTLFSVNKTKTLSSNGDTMDDILNNPPQVKLTYNSGNSSAKKSVEEKNVSDLKIVKWSDGTDEEISAMLKAADEGKIDLSKHWSIGDEREITYKNSVLGETKGKWVLTDFNGTTSGGTKYNAIVHLKTIPTTYANFNTSRNNVGGWQDSYMRSTVIKEFYDALPDGFKSMIKTVSNITAYSGGSKQNVQQTTEDKLWLFAEQEVQSTWKYCGTAEVDVCKQMEYFKTESNKTKYNSSNKAYYWWVRSPYKQNSISFCAVTDTGVASSNASDGTLGVIPVAAI